MKETVLAFLKELQKNNNREWFQANKEWYDEARAEYEGVVGQLIPEIAQFDESIRFTEVKECMFRIYRDVRFSKNKEPYKTNFGAWITRGGRKSSGPGYYFHVAPDEVFLSGGIYMPDPELLKRIRKEIYYNIGEFMSILNSKDFSRYFSQIDDYDKMKKPPREFPADFEQIELLKLRSYTVSRAVDEATLHSARLVPALKAGFRAMFPYNEFLRRARED